MAPIVGRLRRTQTIIKLGALILAVWLTSAVILTRSQYGYTSSGYRDVPIDIPVTPSYDDAGSRQKLRHSRRNSSHSDDIVIYNRVPKCASTSIRMVMKKLAVVHKYNIHVSRIYSQEFLNDTGQSLFVDYVTSLDRPLLFIRHVFFVDFDRHQSTQPVYINMIRDPLDRLVSDYYFKRHNLRNMFPMSDEDRDRTYNECVQANYTECVADTPKGYYRIIPYFCGQQPHCLAPGERSLAQAKRNVEKYYLVVGVVDYVKEFLQILEKLMPRYFSGAPLIYEMGGERFKRMAKTKKKDSIESETIAIMQTKLRYDYEFHQFVKRRFVHQYKELFGIGLS